MTRTFLALDLSDEARGALRSLLRRVAAAVPSARVVNADDLHLTLVFLGELADDTLAAVIELTRLTAAIYTPFTLALDRMGVFGPPHAPRVIWTGVDGDLRDLVTLQRNLADGLELLGFPRESRPYSPHLTLARINHPLSATELPRLTALLAESAPRRVRWTVAEARVMRSETSQTGPRYSLLSAAPFDLRAR